MKLTKQQKILIAVCALGGAAVVVDRLTADDTGPAAASAAMMKVPHAVHARQRADAAKPEPVFDEERSLARRLARVAGEQKLRAGTVDAFRVSDVWVKLSKPDPTREAKAAAHADLRQAFTTQHHLTALLQGGAGEGVAIVNGKPIRVGEVLDGLRLESLGARGAVFSGTGWMVELRLPDVVREGGRGRRGGR